MKNIKEKVLAQLSKEEVKELFGDLRKNITWEKAYESLQVVSIVKYERRIPKLDMLNIFEDIYEINELKKEYRRLSNIYHPDVPGTGDAGIFIKINEAYEDTLNFIEKGYTSIYEEFADIVYEYCSYDPYEEESEDEEDIAIRELNRILDEDVFGSVDDEYIRELLSKLKDEYYIGVCWKAYYELREEYPLEVKDIELDNVSINNNTKIEVCGIYIQNPWEIEMQYENESIYIDNECTEYVDKVLYLPMSLSTKEGDIGIEIDWFNDAILPFQYNYSESIQTEASNEAIEEHITYSDIDTDQPTKEAYIEPSEGVNEQQPGHQIVMEYLIVCLVIGIEAIYGLLNPLYKKLRDYYDKSDRCKSIRQKVESIRDKVKKYISFI
ncbi:MULTISPECIES: hypothetical protein [Calothrix]|uniref:J domain-containing protein n=2 Tax=Calothrix TaxID=1186 RepID=A0ABR8AJL8_9CYAN|nr:MULTISPECIES: hypothetical protein [Calothrix]MBD2200163.1 hypothetical protein [Calothrix parietina FACHB-288]MBD2229127.1 hypothetical protein [Calothrix anomala FACHB-343]